MVEIDEMSELKLERLLKRGVEGESRTKSRRGGIFSLLALGSFSSTELDVLTRFFLGVDSGVMSIEDVFEDEREREAAEEDEALEARVERLPRMEGAVCERVSGREG